MTDRAPNGRSLRAAPLAREGAVLSRSRPTACRFLDGIGVSLTTGILNPNRRRHSARARSGRRT